EHVQRHRNGVWRVGAHAYADVCAYDDAIAFGESYRATHIPGQLEMLNRSLEGNRPGAPGSPKRTWTEKDGRSPTIAFAELATNPIEQTPSGSLVKFPYGTFTTTPAQTLHWAPEKMAARWPEYSRAAIPLRAA